MNQKAKMKMSGAYFPKVFMLLTAVVIVMMLSAVMARTAAAGTNNWSAFASAAGPLVADGSQQTVATVDNSNGAGGASTTSFDVTLGGSIGAGDVSGVYVICGATTWSNIGSFGAQTVTVSGANAKPGNATCSINVTLNGGAAGKTVSVQLNSEVNNDTSAGLPLGPSSALSISAPPASNSYAAIVDGTGPLDADGSQQTVATVPVTPVNGGATVSSYTVDIGGSVVAGDVTGVYVTDGSNTWSATGSYGNGSSVVVTGANAIPGSPLSINVTLAASADTQTVSVTLTTDSNAAATLPTGASAALTITVPVGPANQLTSCADCHTYPPTDGTRAAATGNVVGSHVSHNAYGCDTCHVIPATTTSADFDHRSGTIQMAASINGGYYDKNGNATDDDGPFNQTDSPVLASCENVACHNNTTTPAWGGSAACDTCHALPPNTNAHTTHYTAKGWTTGVTTNCTACHPDNEAVSHSDVTDGIVEVTLTHGGTGGATTCSSWTTGCHNDSANTPTWGSTNITCQQCHSIGGTNTATVANPASGLHDETPTISGVIHNPTNANFADCESCHTASPSASHWDGNSDAPVTFDASITFNGAVTPSTCVATCHSDVAIAGEAWQRLWHDNSDQSNGTECAGCHGDWTQGWNTGVVHRTDADPQGTHGTGTNFECKDCHAFEAATGYTFVTNHANDLITMNTNGVTWGRSGGLSGCSDCHAAYDGTSAALSQHSFTQTGWNPETVSGDTINAGCDSCHGGGGQYWPNGAAYPDREGRHDEHMAELAAALGYTLPGSDAEQKQMCGYCHVNPGAAGHYESPTYVAPADVGGFDRIWDGAADGGASYTVGNQTCANACHNNKTTTAGTYGWRDAGTALCTMCHTAGGNGGAEITDPTSGLHFGTMVTSNTTHDETLDASGCVVCHTSAPSATHLTNGTGETPSVFDAAIGYSSGSPSTCANNCHSDGGAWGRRWSTTAKNADTTRCDNCHGTFDSANAFVTGMGLRHQTNTSGDADGDIEASHDGTDKCYTCHLYKPSDTTYYDFATDHNDTNIQVNDQSFSDNGATVGCGACHASADGTADEDHEFTDTTSRWTRQLIAGPTPSCTGCHSAHITGSAGVGPDSPHSNNVTGLTCEGCHTGHGTAGTIVIPNNTTVGINYTANGESGISLGGTDASGNTEAEICWNCHGAAHSEWGTNTGGSYDYGSVSTPNWSTASWSSANFTYKNGPLTNPPGGQGRASFHDTKRSWPGTTSEAVGDVGCSYCHDVHDTMGPNGKPYLRGAWNPTPYPEDGAPRAGDTYSAGGNPYGAVPRGNTGSSGPGAFQIDQNNGSPNSGVGTTLAAYTSTDGLCELCHDAGALVSQSPLHSNPVKYFSTSYNDNSAARNIFRESDRQAALTRFDPGFAYQNTDAGTMGDSGKGWMGGLRNKDFDTGIAVPPTVGGRYGYQAGNFEWGVTIDDATVDVDYHEFTCSKCHTPHASRLPRLMITNCLDTSVNTWDDQYTGNANWSNWTNVTPGDNRELAEARTAQNCHRDTGEASGPGWNTVTPW